MGDNSACLNKAGSTFHSAQMVVEPGKQGVEAIRDIVTRFERGGFENIYTTTSLKTLTAPMVYRSSTSERK